LAVQVASLNLSCHNCNDRERKYRGCNGEPEQPYYLDNVKLKRCPLKLVHPGTFQYFDYYKYYRKGFLPFPGTINNQPGKLLDVFSIIENEEAKIEENRKRIR